MAAIIIIIIISAVIALGLLTAYLCYRNAFVVPREATKNPHIFPDRDEYKVNAEYLHSLVDRSAALPCDDVYTMSYDGLKLHGRYFEVKKGAPLHILFHGYKGNGFRDFAGGLVVTLESGCNALLIDERGHGDSEGKVLTFGVKERRDVLSWVDFARKQWGEDIPIVIYGISMGAATVLMASELELPENVKGIIADCGYDSPKAIIKKVMEYRHYPAGFMWFFVKIGAALFAHFNPDESTAVDAVKKCRIPVLFIHGDGDAFVPCYMTKNNYEACASEKFIEIFPRAGHGLCYVEDTQRYVKAVHDFQKLVFPAFTSCMGRGSYL